MSLPVISTETVVDKTHQPDHEMDQDIIIKPTSGVDMHPPDPTTYNFNTLGYTVSEEEASYPFVRLFYFWADSILWRGFWMERKKVMMTQEDLLLLPQDEEAITAYKDFKPLWDEELHHIEKVRKTEPDATPRLFQKLFIAYKWDFIFGGIGRLIADGANFAAPFLLRELINWLNAVAVDPDGVDEWEGYIWAVAIAVNQFLMSFANNACLHYSGKGFSKMKSSIAISLFDKAGRLEAENGLEGVAVQLHTTDATKFIEMAFFFHQLWASPILIVGALIALYYFVGWSGVICIGAILIFFPLQGFATARLNSYRRDVADWADKRLSAVGELLFGIRIVKFMGWEKPLAHKIAQIRNEELKIFAWMYYWRSVITIVINFQPAVVSFAVFAIAYAFDDPIRPENVFPTMAMLNVLRMPMLSLPLSVAKLIDLNVSLKRIGGFLSAPEKEIYLHRRSLGDNAIELESVTCQYYELGNPEPRDIISNISLTVPKSKLTIVVGSTGSGKSTLINAMLGESKVDAKSRVTQDGTVAYVPQESWMMNATVRDNILMGKAFDEDLYIRSVKACQLMADLQQLKASDMTEIGERGVNVSGGQKQRVAFARAVYSDRDIVVMDDPLSAVDSHVATALFHDCICGALDGKTRVLVTHHVQFLPSADNIIVVNDRQIEFMGTYDQLMASGIDLAEKLAAEGHSPSSSPSAKDPTTTHARTHAKPDHDETNEEKEAEIQRQKTNDQATKIPPPQEDHLMSAETSKTGEVDLTSLAWYFATQGIVVVLTCLLFFAIWRAVSAVTDLMVSWWSTKSDVIGYTNITDLQYMQWYGIFIGLQLVWLILRQIPFMIGAWRACAAIHEKMVNQLMRAPTSFYDTTPAGRIMARFSKDIEMIDLVIPETLNFSYNMIFTVLGVLGVIIYASTWLIILVVVVLVVYTFVWRFYSATNRAQKRIDSINRSPLASIITQTLSGLTTIRAYNCIKLFDVNHTRAVNAASRSTCSWRATQRWLLIRIDFMSSIMAVVVACVACALVYGGDTLEDRIDLLSVLSLAVTYTISVGGAMGFLVIILADLESSMNSVERCYEYAFEVPQERQVIYGTGPGEKPQPPANWPQQGAVTFKDVCLRYAPDKPQVLKDINIHIKPREKVGIVGRTGSGKSTIMLALFRMVEIESGAMFFDGIDLSDVDIPDVRQALTIIPQDPMLFQGTIRSNLDPFSKSTDDQVWEALDKVGMRERVDLDGRGLLAIVTEKGNNFSVGQRQLLCLARALLKKCKILLLDEATASVDFESDAMIQRTIRNEFKNVTILTIAHRLATVIDSDKILMMDHGVAAEFEHPALLLRDSKTQFHSMVSALGPEQFSTLKATAEEAYLRKHGGSENGPIERATTQPAFEPDQLHVPKNEKE